MTISSTESRWAYVGDGVSTDFPFGNRIFAAADLRVFLDGALQVLGADYGVEGAGEASGSVVFTVPPASGSGIVILRAVPATQEVDYQENDPFPAETHESALDKLTVLVQQGQAEEARTLRLPESEATATLAPLPDAAARAGRVLAFDGTGGPVVSGETLAEIQGAATSAAAAAASATAASGSAAAASGSAGAASGSAGAAAASAQAAAASLTAAGLPEAVESGDAGRGLAVAAGGAGYDLTPVPFGSAAFVEAAAFQGTLNAFKAITASGTWSREPGTRRVMVMAIGGGGSGGGTAATGAGQGASAGGGGGGGATLALLDVSAIASATVTIGAGGTAPAVGGNSGNAGGSSVWTDGTHAVTATGGSGGVGSAAGSGNIGAGNGSGGSGSGGSVALGGGDGGAGAVISGTSIRSGFGGASALVGTANPPGGGNGPAGKYPGGGGAGARSGASVSAGSGGAGADGLVLVWEYK